MNVFTFSGRLAADAELRTTASGEKALGFRTANDVGFGDRKSTNWIDCTVWGKRAEALAPHLTKGKQVLITGEVTLREFEKRDGTRGASMSVRVAEIDLVGGGNQPRDDKPAAGHTKHHEEKANGYAPKPDDLDDEIPF